MKSLQIISLLALFLAMACNSSQGLIMPTDLDYKERTTAMEKLYDKVSATEEQKIALRMVDKELLEALKTDLSTMDSQLIVNLRYEQLLQEENYEFRQILSAYQYEIYAIEKQLLTQNFMATGHSDKQLVLIR